MKVDFGLSPVEAYKQSIVNTNPIENTADATIDSNKGEVGKVNPSECKTCQNRKYKDGSDEMVSFKSPTHISPGAAGAAVRGHEQEHVSNAYKSAAQKDGKVINASVSIHMSTCPECGRSYVSGGTTNTLISYKNDAKPKLNIGEAGKGNAVDVQA